MDSPPFEFSCLSTRRPTGLSKKSDYADFSILNELILLAADL